MPPERPRGDPRPQPDFPNQLPADLTAFLRTQETACLTERTNIGTILIVKLPGPEIESARGRVPMLLRHELYDHPASPVIRIVTRIYDQPDRPLSLDTYINVANEAQREAYADLSRQDLLHVFFYDEQL